MVRPKAGQLDSADEGDDLSADVALVRLEGPSPRPSHPLVLEPPAQVRGELDSLRAWIASSFDIPDELVQGALRLLPGGKPTLALLASAAGVRMVADVHDELPGAPLPHVSPHECLLRPRLDAGTVERERHGRRISAPLSDPGRGDTRVLPTRLPTWKALRFEWQGGEQRWQKQKRK